jgi:hypothetical protein
MAANVMEYRLDVVSTRKGGDNGRLESGARKSKMAYERAAIVEVFTAHREESWRCLFLLSKSDNEIDRILTISCRGEKQLGSSA